MRHYVSLDRFDNKNFERGASRLKEAAWILICGCFIDTWLPGSAIRIFLLRLFGSAIGPGAVLKPRLRIKFPWRLQVGKNCWLGEDVWIDNLAPVTIGDDVCVSQGAFLCTGSHDWKSHEFSLIVSPISIGSQAWICARSIIAPGSKIGEGAVIALGSTFSGVAEPWTIYTNGRVDRRNPRNIES